MLLAANPSQETTEGFLSNHNKAQVAPQLFAARSSRVSFCPGIWLVEEKQKSLRHKSFSGSGLPMLLSAETSG